MISHLVKLVIGRYRLASASFKRKISLMNMDDNEFREYCLPSLIVELLDLWNFISMDRISASTYCFI